MEGEIRISNCTDRAREITYHLISRLTVRRNDPISLIVGDDLREKRKAKVKLE